MSHPHPHLSSSINIIIVVVIIIMTISVLPRFRCLNRIHDGGGQTSSGCSLKLIFFFCSLLCVKLTFCKFSFHYSKLFPPNTYFTTGNLSTHQQTDEQPKEIDDMISVFRTSSCPSLRPPSLQRPPTSRGIQLYYSHL